MADDNENPLLAYLPNGGGAAASKSTANPLDEYLPKKAALKVAATAKRPTDDASLARRDAIEPEGSIDSSLIGLMAGGPAGAAIMSQVGPNDVGKFINEKIDQPSRSAVGLPRTGKDLAKLLGTGDEPLVPADRAPLPLNLGSAAAYAMRGIPKSKLVADAYDMIASPVNLLPLVQKGYEWAGNKLSGKAGALADKYTLNATGSTGKESEAFAEASPQILRDEGIVRLGMTQEQIADAAEKARVNSAEHIGSIVSDLESKGAPLSDRQELALKMMDRAGQLQVSNHEPDRRIGKALETLATDFSNNPNKSLPLSEVEKEKRGYDQLSKWDKLTPETTTEANREAANILRSHVEEVATAVDPGLAGAFTREKNLYSVVKPIEKAAARRAAVTRQSPPLGFNDMTAAFGGSGMGATIGGAIGGMFGGPMAADIGRVAGGTIGGLGSVGARRLIAPRFSSTASSVLDFASKALGTEYIQPMEALLNTGVVAAPKVIEMMQTPEGRGSLKFLLKDVNDQNQQKAPKQPPGPIERLKQRNKTK